MKTFHGVALSWTTSGHVIEVKLHRGPCNEIGTTTLRELESLTEHIVSPACDARALLFWSDREAGFCAGADLLELREGMQRLHTTGMLRAAQSLIRRPGGGSIGLDNLRAAAMGIARRGRRALTQPIVTHEVRQFLTRIHHVFDTLDTAPLVTVSALHGVVFGGGFEWALTTDLRVADKSARFALPELRLGIIPGFGGIPRLEREVGQGVTRDLLFSGRSLNAKRALTLGLVSQVTAVGEHVDAARRMAQQAALTDPQVIRHAKSFAKKLPRARLDEELETFLAMMRSPTFEVALDRFAESNQVRPYLP